MLNKHIFLPVMMVMGTFLIEVAASVDGSMVVSIKSGGASSSPSLMVGKGNSVVTLPRNNGFHQQRKETRTPGLPQNHATARAMHGWVGHRA